MKFVYLGCDGAPEVSVHYGVEFTIGRPAEVTDQSAIAKLSGHQHFAVAVDSEDSAEHEVDEHDDEREAVVAAARSAGIRIGRKSVETLKRELAEAGNADND